MNKFSRIFTFGCSYTTYAWPTWADIILYQNIGYNLGKAGAGFDYILYRILEADKVFKFTPDDQIIIVLTAPIRWDIIIPDDDNNLKWVTNGLVLTSKYAKYDNELFCVDGIMYKAYYNILLINDYLRNKNLNFIFGSISNLFESPESNDNLFFSNETKNLMKYIKDNVQIKLLDFDSFLNRKNFITKVFTEYSDMHPRPKEHLNWVKDVLIKHVDININISEEIIEKIEKIIDETVNAVDLKTIEKLYPSLYKNRIDSCSVHISDSMLQSHNKKII